MLGSLGKVLKSTAKSTAKKKSVSFCGCFKTLRDTLDAIARAGIQLRGFLGFCAHPKPARAQENNLLLNV